MRHNEKSENIARGRRLLVVAFQTVGVVAVHRPHRRPNPFISGQSLHCQMTGALGDTMWHFLRNLRKSVEKSEKFEKLHKLFSISNVENAKRFDEICWNIEVWLVQKHVNLVDLVKSFPTRIYCLEKIGVGTADNEPLTLCTRCN